jgi:hypothetical protein
MIKEAPSIIFDLGGEDFTMAKFTKKLLSGDSNFQRV